MNQVADLEKLAALRDNGVLTEEEFSKAKARIVSHLVDPNKAPLWMKPWGVYATLIALVGCSLITFANWDNYHIEANAIVFVLNPLFLVVLPLGLYWLYRSGQFEPSRPTTANYSIYLKQKEYQKALDVISSLIQRKPRDAGLNYNRACALSMLGNTEQALRSLEKSFEYGYRKFEHIDKDTDLDTIRRLPEFVKLIDKYKNAVN